MNGIATGAFEHERENWGLALQRVRNERWACVELSALTASRVSSLGQYLATDDLGGFARVSLHAPNSIAEPNEALDGLLGLPFEGDVILHPDLYGAADVVSELGARAVFENMDVKKDFGQTVADLAPVFKRFPEAGFCLDVAHVWTNDRSLDLGHALIDAFGARLRQLHVSGIEPDGSHRSTTDADLRRYSPLLERCGHVPHVFETQPA